VIPSDFSLEAITFSAAGPVSASLASEPPSLRGERPSAALRALDGEHAAKQVVVGNAMLKDGAARDAAG